MYLQDGAKYEGEWKVNRANGNGKFWHLDGDTCRFILFLLDEGEWKDD